MIKGNQRQNFIHLFLSVVGIHIISTHFVFVGLVLYDPVASGWKQPHWLGNIAENSFIDKHRSLSDFFLAFRLTFRDLLLSFHSCCRGLVSKNVVFFSFRWTFIAVFFAFFLWFILIEHIIIFYNFYRHFIIIFLNFSHESHVNKSVYLPFLIFRPKRLWFFFFFFIFRWTTFNLFRNTSRLRGRLCLFWWCSFPLLRHRRLLILILFLMSFGTKIIL